MKKNEFELNENKNKDLEKSQNIIINKKQLKDAQKINEDIENVFKIQTKEYENKNQDINKGKEINEIFKKNEYDEINTYDVILIPILGVIIALLWLFGLYRTLKSKCHICIKLIIIMELLSAIVHAYIIFKQPVCNIFWHIIIKYDKKKNTLFK